MIIESAEEQDIGRIKEIYRSAFPENEHELVATLACKLLVEETEPEILSLIAKTNDTIMGHVAFSPVRIENNQNCKAYILAPLAVDSGYQKQIIGSTLIKQGLEILTDDGIHLVFVYGDPEFYGRFGFRTDTASEFNAPYDLEYPFGWQATVLKEWTQKNTPAAVSCVSSLSNPDLW
ncbi:MAG TPA: N-acetyltransferase [SAR324 cluster bacterium]|nr:N-acetyltransferase [SAR324 cluster bacterium]